MDDTSRTMAQRLSAAVDEASLLPTAHGVLVVLLRCSPYEADLSLEQTAVETGVPALDLAKALIEVYSRHTEGLRDDTSLDRAYAVVASRWMADGDAVRRPQRRRPAAPSVSPVEDAASA